jgi:hypothetical protein
MIFITDDPLVILKNNQKERKKETRVTWFTKVKTIKRRCGLGLSNVTAVARNVTCLYYLAPVFGYIDVRFKGTHVWQLKPHRPTPDKLQIKMLVKKKKMTKYFVHEIITNITHTYTHKYCLITFGWDRSAIAIPSKVALMFFYISASRGGNHRLKIWNNGLFLKKNRG